MYVRIGEGTPLRVFLDLRAQLRAIAQGWAQKSRRTQNGFPSPT